MTCMREKFHTKKAELKAMLAGMIQHMRENLKDAGREFYKCEPTSWKIQPGIISKSSASLLKCFHLFSHQHTNFEFFLWKIDQVGVLRGYEKHLVHEQDMINSDQIISHTQNYGQWKAKPLKDACIESKKCAHPTNPHVCDNGVIEDCTKIGFRLEVCIKVWFYCLSNSSLKLDVKL